MSAALYINGRQNKADFLVGSRTISQQLQQIVNQTQTGFYPRNANFKCDINLAFAPNVHITPGGTADLGENGDCIFAGTAVVFDPSASQNTAYRSYALAGRRTYTNASQVVDVDSAKVAWVTANPYATDTLKVLNGLTYYGGRNKGAPTWNTSSRFGVAFLSSFADFGANNDGGSQRIELRGFTTAWGVGVSDLDVINSEAGQPNPYGVGTLSGVELCFNSGGTDQSVVVSVSDGLAATYAIKAGSNCP
ncbi:hypothetical protein JNM87_01060 [Candidatus Saccharibacteria bacterium]|nr:hypothetical protein [Candidatus Saccharibacteria bacterium]